MPDSEYNMRCEETLVRRLIRVLADRGVLTGDDLIRLAFPPEADIDNAEMGDLL